MLKYRQPIILIVDDNKKNLQFLGNLLEEYDYQLFFAQNGEQALDFVKDTKPDIILLDVMMPGINGFEVCKIIKKQEQHKDIPIIFLTAKSQINDILEGFEVGGSDYVTKPFNSAELLSRINAHLELKLAREEITLLRRLVTICSHCKSIRDKNGKWKSIESYMFEETDIDLSHGLCPKCLRKLYPDMAEDILSKDK